MVFPGFDLSFPIVISTRNGVKCPFRRGCPYHSIFTFEVTMLLVIYHNFIILSPSLEYKALCTPNNANFRYVIPTRRCRISQLPAFEEGSPRTIWNVTPQQPFR